MKRLFLILIAATAALTSCREIILEDRTQCPSFLFFDITNSDKFLSLDDVFTNVYSHPKTALMEERESTVKSIQDKDLYFVVKGTSSVKGYGLLGYDGLIQNGSEWTIPVGQEYVSLFRYQYQEAIQEESFIVPVEFVKDYCHVSLQFVGMETFSLASGRFPFDIVVKGNTSGINALTGVPVRGAFEFRPEEKTIGSFEFTLPRQADRNLLLELYGREGLHQHPGFVDSFDLYDILLQKGGVTWTEKNLPDVELQIDYQQMTVTVNITAWESSSLEYVQ